MEPETMRIAPTKLNKVRCSGVTNPGNSQVIMLIDAIVKIGARAKIALTFEASQCWSDSAKQP